MQDAGIVVSDKASTSGVNAVENDTNENGSELPNEENNLVEKDKEAGLKFKGLSPSPELVAISMGELPPGV